MVVLIQLKKIWMSCVLVNSHVFPFLRTLASCKSAQEAKFEGIVGVVDDVMRRKNSPDCRALVDDFGAKLCNVDANFLST